MTTKVTEHGVLISKDLLRDVEEVDIRKEHDRIIITPIVTKDPILELGREPVAADVDDASVNHDLYVHH